MPDIAITEKKYDKDARSNNIVELWRKKYFSHLNGKILEVGIGSGKNIDYLNNDARVTGIDISEKTLNKAKQKLIKSGKKNITLRKMNIEDMDFDDNSFDFVISFCVFCSVSDPVRGLREIKRTLRPTGKLVMIEHVLSGNKMVAFFENLLNPLVRFITGISINRDTKQNIINSGLKIIIEKNLALIDIFRLFVVRK